MFKKKFHTQKGYPYPLGATPDEGGVNFSIYSQNATSVSLCLFNRFGKEIRRFAVKNKTNDIWHIYICGLKEGQQYAYRVGGRYAPMEGLRFNRHKLLLDPAAKLLTKNLKIHSSMFAYNFNDEDEDFSFNTTDSARFMPKCIVADTEKLKQYLNTQHPKTPWNKTVLYEMHIKGFSIHNPKISSYLRGKILGLSAKRVCNYLTDLGITATELLPIAANANPTFLQEKGLTNYWGYDPVCFMAPQPSYLTKDNLQDIQKTVQTLHNHGIEVILDVVYNHTGEGNHLGPSVCLKGIDNSTYYRLSPDNKRYYMNDTGCGNMLNFDNPATLELVLNSMRYWVEVFGIDGFRFDLATTLGRTGDGSFSPDAPFFKALKEDKVLKNVKLIAEPWDIGWGGYQYGNFPQLFGQWNDKFRDACRRFWKGDIDQVAPLFCEFTGVQYDENTQYQYDYHRINFLTAHDGFTACDLVSYNDKHNDKNCENNMDGNNTNWSWNSGVEGFSSNKKVQEFRLNRLKAMMATLLLSNGTPMLLAGDEFLNTQFGNNNAYSQDNEISWLDWKKQNTYTKQMHDFVQSVLKMRKAFPLFSQNTVSVLQNAQGRPFDISDVPHGLRDFGVVCQTNDDIYFIIFNANNHSVRYELQKDKKYACLLSTTNQVVLTGNQINVDAWSLIILKQQP